MRYLTRGGIAVLTRKGPRTEIGEKGKRQLYWAVSFAFLAPLLLVGCEYPGIPHPLAAQAAAASGSAPESEAGQKSTQASAANAQAVRVVEGKVDISLQDFRLDPERLAVKTGTVTFVLTNDGRFTHDFRVEGQGLDEKAPKVGQGRTSEWQVILPPGTYRISCPISNHADRGMVGTLEVAP